jgi:Flp pilus assembly pilin Flp
MLKMLTQCRIFVERIREYGDEKGVTTVEYAIMLALVALAVAAATPGLSDAVVAVFEATTDEMDLGT